MKNEKGMSLVGVLVAMGLMSILTLGLMDLNMMMLRTNTTAIANSDMLAYVNQLRANVQYAQNSTASLSGNAMNSSVTMKDPLAPTVVMAAANFKQRPQDPWKVKNVRFDNVTAVPSQTNLFRGTLVIVFEVDQTRVMGGTIQRKIIGDVFCLTNAGTIASCYGSTDLVTIAENNCKSLGGSWDIGRAYGSQCAFPNQDRGENGQNSGNNGNNNSNSHDRDDRNAPCDGH